jgi:drug/metabolite transporter (DMT)-like permease
MALVAGCLIARQPLLGYDRQTMVVLALLALVPQVFGHSVFNWALARVSPLVVTLAILGEPIGASALAFLVLNEAPPPTLWLGAPLLLAGLALVSSEGATPAAPPARPTS